MSEPRPTTESELTELLHALDERAPDELHARVQALLAERPPRRAGAHLGGSGGLRRARLGGGVVAVAALVVALMLVLSGGARSTPDVSQVSAATLRTATTLAPAESTSARGTLTAVVDGIAFPYWDGRFGWRASGARTDRIDGRTVTTVFYDDAGGQRIGYAILAGTPAPGSSGGTVVWRAGTAYRLLTLHGAPAVAWQRAGHLCVVAGRGVSSATLLQLASWQAHGSSA
jgi:hypothetical protein